MSRRFQNNTIMLIRGDNLPQVPEDIDYLYLDLETTSGDDKKNSLNPWFNCSALGVAITWDDCPLAYYIPLRHRRDTDINRNVNIGHALSWLKEVVRRSKNWVNHNIKYDAHVLANSCKLSVSDLPIQLHDTLTLAKLWDSDRLQYTLSSLSRDCLFESIDDYEDALKPYLKSPGGQTINKDYGKIPLEVMAPYAGQDVHTVRKLYHRLLDETDTGEVWETEKKVTKVLFQIEQRGVKLDGNAIVRDLVDLPALMSNCVADIKRLTGLSVLPHKQADCLSLFLGHFGCEVAERTEKGDPSFGKEALRIYKQTALEQNKHTLATVVDHVKAYKDAHKLYTGFTESYIKLAREQDLTLHCFYNQAVRTARLACKDPNMQQVPPEAKKYIIPREGFTFIEKDLSQIEYRIIAHYIGNPAILEAYQKDANADYHQVMANICDIERKPAKNMNFAVSFGAGKKKTIAMLKDSFDPTHVPNGEDFDIFCERKGEEIYKEYHKRVPELKNTMWNASTALRQKKYIKNLFGRVRKLPVRFHFKAFNNAVQSSAADIMKLITVSLAEQLPPDCHILIIVHDSWLIECPTVIANEVNEKITEIIENLKTPLSVPIYCSGGMSSKNWSECD